jgi:hypothetical protein
MPGVYGPHGSGETGAKRAAQLARGGRRFTRSGEAVHRAWHPPGMWMYFAAAVGLLAALSLPFVVAARSLALAAATRADRARDELGPERRARLERYVSR